MSHPAPSSIADIIDAILQLTPEQRRQLQKRLRVAGLLIPETLVTDQKRLAIAPAVHMKRSRQARPTSNGKLIRPLPAEQRARAPLPATPLPPTIMSASSAAEPTAYRSPVSGKVVVGTLTDSPTPDDPHAMLPLPGQAPEQPIAIIFDGGSKGNPGQGYGSYTLRWPGAQQQIVRLRFGDRVTNNEAEYDTLIAALEAVLKRLLDNGAAPETAQLDIRGDSLLVVNQVHGKWQVKEERMQTRRDQVRTLLQRFGHWQLTHHDRENSVRALGH